NSTGTALLNFTGLVSVLFFSYPAICSSESCVPPSCASCFAKSFTCGLVNPTHPCDAKPPSFAGALPPCIRDGKPIGILIGPRGFNLSPASILSPTFPLPPGDSTQGSSGGVHVGLKMIVSALPSPVGSGNSGNPSPSFKNLIC